MVAMMKFNPELAKSDMYSSSPPPNARPPSIYSSSGASRQSSHPSTYGTNGQSDYFGDYELGGDDEVPVGHHFTFIPPNPKKFYRRLLESCLVADLEIMLSPEIDDNDEVSLGILSPPHIDLLNECALRWRIGQQYRVTCFLDLVRQFYERNDVPLECVPEAMQTVSKAISDLDINQWTVHDVRLSRPLAL
jgi:hypothetical protein